jgi:hypothetical protein
LLGRITQSFCDWEILLFPIPAMTRDVGDLSWLAVDFGNVWCWFWPLLFKLPNYQIAHLPIFATLCLCPSAEMAPTRVF